MARIQIEWVTWRKPPKVGAKAFEYLKVQVDEENVSKRSFEDFRMMLNPESLGKEDFVYQLKHEERSTLPLCLQEFCWLALKVWGGG